MSKDKDNNIILDNNITAICSEVISMVKYARSLAIKNINLIQLVTYYTIGKWIVEEQQNGQERAGYGKKVLETLSNALNKEFGKGFSIATLENYRKFYIMYKDRIPEPVVREFAELKTEPVVRELKNVNFFLDWSHYLILMRIENEQERNFYEIESKKSNWNKRTGFIIAIEGTLYSPTYPSVSDLKTALKAFTVCAKLSTVEKLLAS